MPAPLVLRCLPHDTTVAAGCLGFAKRSVCMSQESFNIPRSHVERSFAEARSDAACPQPKVESQTFDSLSQLLCDLRSSARPGLREKHGELFPTESADKVRTAKLLNTRLDGVNEHDIAGGVAVIIIERLKVIEIE